MNRNICAKLKFFFKIRRLKREADKHRDVYIQNGIKPKDATQYIVKVGGEIRIISKLSFKNMKSRGIFPKNMTSEHLNKIALYKTK
jgi:hypothetical protein